MTQPNPSSIQEHVDGVLREYRASRRDYAGTFIKMARKFAAIPGISHHRAVQLAQDAFPGSYGDYVRRQNLGEKLPVLFPAKGAEKRLAAMVANGGRLN
jgi:hypothetical protein